MANISVVSEITNKLVKQLVTISALDVLESGEDGFATQGAGIEGVPGFEDGLLRHGVHLGHGKVLRVDHVQ